MKTCTLAAAGSLLAILLAGCGGADAPDGAAPRPEAAPGARTGPTAPRAPESKADLPEARPAARSGPLAGVAQDFGYSVNPSGAAGREQVRLFYKTVFASSDGIDAGWTGNVAGCVPGETSSEYKAAILRRVNWYRAMAGVPATIQFDATFNSKAQQAALYMSANNTLTHTPTSGACFNAIVAEAAGKSDLALGSSGVGSVTNYMSDSGPNNNVVGHRRWILYPQTRQMGTGDITGSPAANALWILDSHFGEQPRPTVRDTFVAWPAKGYSPYPTTYARWSFAYPSANFNSATVSMKENGSPISTCVETVQTGFGENTLVWRPKCMSDSEAWTKPAGDTTYEVTISGVNGIGISSFTYNVIVFDPDVPGAGDGPIGITGSGTAPAGQATPFTFAAVPGATSYAWRSLQTTAYALNDGAEGGTGNFTVPANPGYSIIANDVHATGGASFHLTHLPGVDQSLVLNAELGVSAGTELEFKSRLGIATASQTALVELSADDGKSWSAVFQQAGNFGAGSESGETSFSTKTISLASYANRTVHLRFRYARNVSGSYFPQSDTGVGWYIDDIKVTGASQVVANAQAETATAGFQFTGTSQGNVLLQARPAMFGYFGDWGLTKFLTITAPIPLDPRDCLLNWAEAQLPGVLAPHASSFNFAGYYLRFYPALNIYTGIGDVDNSVYYYANSTLVNLGNKGPWLAQAGCN